MLDQQSSAGGNGPRNPSALRRSDSGESQAAAPEKSGAALLSGYCNEGGYKHVWRALHGAHYFDTWKCKFCGKDMKEL